MKSKLVKTLKLCMFVLIAGSNINLLITLELVVSVLYKWLTRIPASFKYCSKKLVTVSLVSILPCVSNI
ncbi:hypothetical protein BpHYR1_033584 [Brachionus plicatilis]|uniref:Uncharacterized protein n=1 Tax=Brachionus plicatilis TaxID=10195 RepID=A0A3M7RIE3_BRAPC|nr:hypothetical protein BpHYR1_033584 [Brachionus plicatilis]